MPKPIAERSLAAEVRAVEEGHHAFLKGSTIAVNSDTTPGLVWLVKATANATDGSPVLFRCSPSNPTLARGRGHGTDYCTEQGALPCKHAALAARRLEREGFIRFQEGPAEKLPDGSYRYAGWVVTAKAAALISQRYGNPADPFKGLPR